MDNEQILNHLGLIKEGKIMRAAMMLFHKNPEKWINGSYVKVGFSRPMPTCAITMKFMARSFLRQKKLLICCTRSI